MTAPTTGIQQTSPWSFSKPLFPCGFEECKPETFSPDVEVYGDVRCPLKDIQCQKKLLCPCCHQRKPNINLIITSRH